MEASATLEERKTFLPEAANYIAKQVTRLSSCPGDEPPT